MKRYRIKFLFLLTILFTSKILLSQISFSHSGFVGFYVSGATHSGGYAFIYSPRLNFLELGDEKTLSIGTHLGLGFSGTTNTPSGFLGALLFDIPLLLELNIGDFANNETRSENGAFIGAGIGYNKMANSESYSLPMNSFGPVFNLGFRKKALTIRFSFLLNTIDNGENIFGFALLHNFGM